MEFIPETCFLKLIVTQHHVGIGERCSSSEKHEFVLASMWNVLKEHSCVILAWSFILFVIK